MKILDQLLSKTAKKIATNFLKEDKKLILEWPVHLPYPSNITFTKNICLSFPTIPSFHINPWLNANIYPSFRQKPLLHLRSREFANEAAVVTFLNDHSITPSLIDILVVYGDSKKNSSHGLAPYKVIPILKNLGFKVGCVFNPNPVIRNIEEEHKHFLLKISAQPDFMISQCTYDFTKFFNFCRLVPESIKILACLGFWHPYTNLKKLGINPYDELGKKHNYPSTRLINQIIVWQQCSGIYICDYSEQKD